MAFGDLVKKKFTSSSGSTVLSLDLGSNPTSGNLLVLGFGSDSPLVTVSTAPVGFTLVYFNSSGNSASWAYYYKISDGTEQTRSITWSGSSANGRAYIEYEWDGSTPTVTKNQDTSNIVSATNTQATGAATPTSSTNICIAYIGADASSLVNGGQATDGSWVEDQLFIGLARGFVAISSLVNVTGSQEATHTNTDTGDQMYGAIAIFDVASVSGDFIQSIAGYGGIAGKGGTAGAYGGIAR